FEPLDTPQGIGYKVRSEKYALEMILNEFIDHTSINLYHYSFFHYPTSFYSTTLHLRIFFKHFDAYSRPVKHSFLTTGPRKNFSQEILYDHSLVRLNQVIPEWARWHTIL